MQFMQGRYGVDKTFYVLFFFSAVLAIINTFFRFWVIQLIVYGIVAYALFRCLSRNIDARIKENDFVTKKLFTVTQKYNAFRQQKADTTHIYKKCPKCKAVLRLPRRKGKHTTTCPKCGNVFNVRVYK